MTASAWEEGIPSMSLFEDVKESKPPEASADQNKNVFCIENILMNLLSFIYSTGLFFLQLQSLSLLLKNPCNCD